MNNPILRFSKESGNTYPDWNIRTIESLCENILGGGTPSKSNTEYWEGTIPWVSSSDLSLDKIGGLNVSRFISQEAIEHSSAKIIKKGSVLIVSRVGVGKVAVAPFNLCTSQDFTNLVSVKCNRYFLAYALTRLMKFKSKAVQGTAIKGIPASELKHVPLAVPCEEEQQKIAVFFSTLDEKIELSERKLEALEQLKKGLMQKIFSLEVRIKDSKGNDYCTWKNCSLSEISEPLSYGLNAAASEFDGSHKYLRITDIDERTFQYLSGDPVSPSVLPEEKYRLKEGDIVFARTGNSVGKTYLYDKNDGDLYYAGFLIKAHVKAGICPYFVFLQTQTPKYKNWVRIMSQRSGQPGINAEEYGKYPLQMPCLEEQEKIALLFKTLDRKIFNSLEKIETLKQLKKGFMQQMFV